MTVRGADALIAKLNKLPRNLKRGLQDALEVSAAEQMNYAVVRIQKNSGSGRTYRRGKRVHVASAPGEFPNTDFGELVRSAFWEKRGDMQAAWGFTSKHAKPLELGTSRMAARPMLRPTFNALYSRASARVMTAVNAAVKRG